MHASLGSTLSLRSLKWRGLMTFVDDGLNESLESIDGGWVQANQNPQEVKEITTYLICYQYVKMKLSIILYRLPTHANIVNFFFLQSLL